MNEFSLTSMTRLNANTLQNKNNARDVAAGLVIGGQTDAAGFAQKVHEKLLQKEEYRGESYFVECRKDSRHTDSTRKRKEKSFWEKRAKRHKLYMDLAQKAWYKRENEREYQESIDLHRRELSSALLQQWSLERVTGKKTELGVNPSVLSDAAAEFTQGYVFFKIPSARVNSKLKFMK